MHLPVTIGEEETVTFVITKAFAEALAELQTAMQILNTRLQSQVFPITIVA